MQRKSQVAGRLFFLLGLSAVGCGDGGAAVEGPPQPYKGVVLRVACPAGAPADVVTRYSRGWASRNGATVEVRPGGVDPGAGADGADLRVLPPAELPHWAAQGKLHPLPPDYQSADNPYQWYRLLPLYREKLLVWDRKAYGLPLLGESPLCCYRADLFADDRHKSEFAKQSGKAPGPPATWDDFAALAAYFHEAGRGPSLPPLPADDDDLGREFFAVAATYARRAIPLDQGGARGDDTAEEEFAFHYDLKTGKPRIDQPGFVQALRLLQRLQKFRPAEPAASPAQAFRDGKAVLCLTDATHLHEFQASPAVRDKFGVCRLPGSGFYFDYETGAKRVTPDDNRVPYLGASGWLAVVPQASAHPEAAFALLAELTGPKVSAEIVQEPRWGGGATRDEHFRSARWDAFDLDPERTVALKEALRDTVQYQIRNPVLVLRTPDEAPHRAALAAEVRAALADPNADAAQALARVARRWEELDKARGEQRHLADYRISLGLLGR